MNNVSDSTTGSALPSNEKREKHDSLARFKKAFNPDREIVLYEHPNGEKTFMSQTEAWAQDALIAEQLADPCYGRKAMEEIQEVLSKRMLESKK